MSPTGVFGDIFFFLMQLILHSYRCSDLCYCCCLCGFVAGSYLDDPQSLNSTRSCYSRGFRVWSALDPGSPDMRPDIHKRVRVCVDNSEAKLDIWLWKGFVAIAVHSSARATFSLSTHSTTISCNQDERSSLILHTSAAVDATQGQSRLVNIIIKL